MMLLRWLGAALALGLPLAADANEPVNPFRLIPEAELAQRFDSEVETLWRQVRTDRLSVPGGIQLAYAHLPHADADTAVVISSGRTENYLKYKELVRDLHLAGYAVYIHDHRGQGQSSRLLPDPDDAQKGHVDRFDDYVDDLHRFVQEVVLKGPQKRLFLLAHSMGGGIAARYLQQHQGVFSAAAFSAPMMQPNAKILFAADSSCTWFKASAWFCPTCYAGMLPSPYQDNAPAPNAYTASPLRNQLANASNFTAPRTREGLIGIGGPTRRWVAEACRASEKIVSEAGALRTPLLVLQAGQDEAVMPDAQSDFCARRFSATRLGCNGDQVGPRVIAGAQHELFIEADEHRQQALTAVLRFFASQPVPAALAPAGSAR